ncbi:hypothetical protein [Okeania sp. SIO2C2]|uniref:hypothetical protein n=1 Tax=Okeania sp. SIO2C2 TaxID=2607787 RepID=UPI00257EC2A2|nr:hypothetical protein [Okeania sp. SIO2C2]
MFDQLYLVCIADNREQWRNPALAANAPGSALGVMEYWKSISLGKVHHQSMS